jgi:hypothetical protein
MIHEFLVRDRIDEVLHEAEKVRMIEKVIKATKRSFPTLSKYFLVPIWIEFCLLND